MHLTPRSYERLLPIEPRPVPGLLLPLRGCLLILFVLGGLLGACQGDLGGAPPSESPAEEGWYRVYFTDPQKTSGKGLRGGPDQALAQAIRAARVSVDVAVLNLNLWSVRDALLDAQQRGVKVRLVVDSDYREGEEIQALLAAGIPVLGDRREGFMHNKFVIIDRAEVWTGSMNFTVSDVYYNNNHLVRLRSADLAQNYLVEFEEMFTDDQFGPGSPANTPSPRLLIEGTEVHLCFAPEDGCQDLLLKVIRQAQYTIHFMAYSFTSDPLAEALLERARHGVTVLGLMEASQVRSNVGTEYYRFKEAGLEVRLDGNPRQMHHKVMVFDAETVAFGSYNYTYFAENRNDENLLIIRDASLAKAFLEEFQRLYDQGDSGGHFPHSPLAIGARSCISSLPWLAVDFPCSPARCYESPNSPTWDTTRFE